MSKRTKKSLSTLEQRRGMGTVEIVIIIAVLVALALIFRTALMGYAENIMDFVFNDGAVTGSLS